MTTYRDLISFDPIESVVQLREADARDKAERLVRSFVVSDRMADQLANIVVPQLQFDTPADNKGILIVGNYGTGKSHLMAVLSAVAEHAGLAGHLSHASSQKAAATIAGRFKVLRAEIGGVKMSLRDIICGELERGLSAMGVDYTFKPIDKIGSNHKDAFHELMGRFGDKFPSQGLLLVVDELLDFLRSRHDQELILDLNFLREIGEVCRTTRFRFIAGLQESLFDNPRFAFVGDSVRRVKDRFEQVRIAREDVAFVVAERLLKKSSAQKAVIREHLLRFAPLYGTLNERIDEFVQLFPVHPAYLDTFERVYTAEKREILKTISAAMTSRLDQQVPENEPGLLAYDSYWTVLRDNAAMRAIPEIKEVLDRSSVLEDRIKQAFSKPAYRPAALRIIHALSVHRLTTTDIYAPIGPTAEELRDSLCLFIPNLPEQDSEFLRTMVETVLGEIEKTVSGQFLGHNRENGQYFLDLKKDVDFDAQIEKRADALEKSTLDRYYYDALARVMECADETHKSGFKIWEHEVEWRERQAGRLGYLFFGAPNERSTAQPPRDFYLYFLQPFEPPRFTDSRSPDEVFFKLARRDPDFEKALTLYAGAREQAVTAAGANKRIYESKATTHLQTLTTWLRTKMDDAFDVVHEGRSRKLSEVVRGRMTAQPSVADIVNTAGALCLGAHFQNQSPEYPTFTTRVTKENRARAAEDALKGIVGPMRSRVASAVLDALQLLDGDELRPHGSKYATAVLKQLQDRGPSKVVNHSELVRDEQGVPYWQPFRVEPEFLVVVIAALVHSGDIVLAIPGSRIDASSVDRFKTTGIADLVNFKHLERPKDLPTAPLQELFDLLGLQRGLIVNEATRTVAVVNLQTEVANRANRVAVAVGLLADLKFGGKAVLSSQEEDAIRTRLGELKTFLESLQPFNLPGKLKNFPYDVAGIQKQRGCLDALADVEQLAGLVQQTAQAAGYLIAAESLLPQDHPDGAAIRASRGEWQAKIADPVQRKAHGFGTQLEHGLASVRKLYAEAYAALHQKARLGLNDDRKKGKLAKDPRLKVLRELASIELMPKQQFRSIETELLNLKTCHELTSGDLDASPYCPHCQYRPSEEPLPSAAPAQRLDHFDQRFDALLVEWTKTLLENLNDPTIREQVGLVRSAEGRKAIQQFLKARTLPDTVDTAFVKALQELFSGLERVQVTGHGIHAALTKGGSPCTLDEAKDRFEQFLRDVSKGKDSFRVRIVLEDE
jgi:hypothetical protein